MTDIILNKLASIEAENNVKIIYAAESGSRAWGFASPDSDYDVRFIYIHKKDYYLRLDETEDVIEPVIENILDFSGWDVKKALKLLHGSNPSLFEWMASPVIYKTTPEYEKIQNISDNYFVPKTAYHYYGMAMHNHKAYFGSENVKLKKYFYVLRPILACEYVLNHKTMPPIIFTELANTMLVNNAGIKSCIDEILALKTKKPELELTERIPELDAYISAELTELKSRIDALPNNPPKNWAELNELFILVLR